MPKSNYDEIANEYYDDGHITSRNFDMTTISAIETLQYKLPQGKILELGAGRGRAGEFFQAQPADVVQLDNSTEMFELEHREECSLKVFADACDIPLVSDQFEVVVGLLADPFFGLHSMSESYRLLRSDGELFLTLPTYEWARRLRYDLNIDVMTTRFCKIRADGEMVILPSLVHTPKRIDEILSSCGFVDININDHALPKSVTVVSPDIRNAAKTKGVSEHELPIIHTIRAKK